MFVNVEFVNLCIIIIINGEPTKYHDLKVYNERLDCPDLYGYTYIYIKINYFLTFDFLNENKSWFKCVIFFLLTKSSLSMRCIPPCDTSKGMQNVVYTVSKSVNFWYQQEWSLMWCLRSDLLKKTAVFLFHSFLVLN